MPDRLFASVHPVARTAGSTAHSQIEHWFMDMLARGELTPGDRLPRENDLATAFGVSRMTLRQALAGLEQRGIVNRVPGRSGGTFVVEPKIDCDLTGLAGFTEQLRRANLHARARVLGARTTTAGRAVALALGIERDAAVHEIVRVRSSGELPLALERSYFPAGVLPDLLSHRLTGSLYQLLATEYDQAPHTASEHLEAVVPSATEASYLGLAAGLPAMLIERTAFTLAGLPVEYARDLFRSDRVRISVRSGLSSSTASRTDHPDQSAIGGSASRSIDSVSGH
jgi:GntR family transcriptional regulator